MNFAWAVERDSGVSLVRCRVHNDSAVPRRVRIESQLDGPVLPPRRAGIPESGWDETGVTFRLEPDERRAFGFAAPAEPVEPPVAIVRSPAVDTDGCRSKAGSDQVDVDPETRGRNSERVTDALRDLAEHRPPRAAIAAGKTDVGRDDGNETRETEQRVSESTIDDTESAVTDREPPSRDSIDKWLDAVECRIDRAEQMTDADLSTATDVVAAAGGADELAALDERIESDVKRLREISERASSLATRAEATDTPVEALERLS
mgnify:CR=1 FL=1